MARILSIQPDVPEKSFGGRKRVFHLTEALRQAQHEVHLIVAMNEADYPSLQALEDMGVQCYPVFHKTNGASGHITGDAANPVRHWVGRAERSLRFRRRTLRTIGDTLPKVANAHWIMPLRQELRRVLQREQFDLVIIENEENASLANLVPRDVPVLIDVQNVLSSMAEREVDLHSWRKLFSLQHLSERTQPAKLRRFERSMMQRFDALIAMSELEAQRLRQIAPEYSERVHIVENGVDVQSYAATQPAPGTDRIVFTGLISYYPNVDALLWFAREVWPLIVQQRPATRLDIVGAEPPPEIRALGEDARIRVTGRVEQVQPYLEAADVVIVPLRNGGGTRLKILEAAAMQRPIVSTTIGAEGLDGLNDGEHLLLRDTPRDFAQGVVELLENRTLGERLAQAARTVVEEHYDWPLLGRKFAHIAAATLDQTKTSAYSESVI